MRWRPVLAGARAGGSRCRREPVPEEPAVFDSIIDPTLGRAADPDRGPAALAARPASLSGLRLGLLANTKRNAEQFLAEVGMLLTERHGVTTVVPTKKPTTTTPTPPPILPSLP